MPKKLLDQVLVVDVEATCWERQPPQGEESEIIEIGICRLDIATGERREKRSLLIKPERSTVSAFCTRLTTLTQEQVDSGISFAAACDILKRDYLARERVWASYGDYDRRMFQQQSGACGIDYPFGLRHLNVKTLYALSSGLPHEVGMDEALRVLRLPLEGTHHRADDDAWNIAQILATLLMRMRDSSAAREQADVSSQ